MRIVRKRLLGLARRGLVGLQRIDALRDVERALIAGVDGVGVIAARGCHVGVELRLQIGRIELRERLSGANRIAFADVYGVGGLGERALNRDVLIGRDDAGEITRRLDGSKACDGDLHVGSGRRLRGRTAGASRYG